MKINKLSVPNNTRRSIRTSGDASGLTSSALGSPSEVTPVDSAPVQPLFKNPNVLKVSGTTTTLENTTPNSREPSSSSAKQFHEDLCDAFRRARKSPPFEKQSQEAYGLLLAKEEAFLAWLPNSDQFAGMRSPGGLKTLIGFFHDAGQIAPGIPAPPLPKWKPEQPATCDRCHGTGWAIVDGPRGSGVDRCDCGARVKGQWEGI